MIYLDPFINSSESDSENDVRLLNEDTPFTITTVIDTALCIGAGGSTGSLTDKPIVRNAQGKLIIPGSHLKGHCDTNVKSWLVAWGGG